jgi:hypothetical protein
MKALLILLCSLITLSTYAGSVEFGISEYPPYTSSTLRQNGLLGYYVNHIFSQEGIAIKISSHRRNELMNEEIKEGKVFGAFPVIEQRNTELYEYSSPLIVGKYVFIYRKGLEVNGVNFMTFKGLEKFKIGALIATMPFRNMRVLSELNVTGFTSSKEIISKFSNRSIDLIVFEKTSWSYYSKLNKLESFDEYVLVDGPWNEQVVYMEISKKYPEYKKYLEILNKGISKFDLNKMIKDHFY